MSKSYVFQVSEAQSDSWRAIQADGKHKLDDLSQIILEAFEFDKDHLYGFFMDNEAWSLETAYWSPEGSHKPSAQEINLEQLDFAVGNSFLYLYDFVEEWLFQVQVTKVLAEETPQPIIVDGYGEAPEQYSNYDDEDDDDYDDDDD